MLFSIKPLQDNSTAVLTYCNVTALNWYKNQLNYLSDFLIDLD